MFHRGSGGSLLLRLLAAEKEPGVQLPIDVLLFDKRTSPYTPPPSLRPSTPLSLLLFCLPSLRRSMCAGRLLFVLPCRKNNIGGASLPSLGLLHCHGWLPARVLTFDPLKLSHPTPFCGSGVIASSDTQDVNLWVTRNWVLILELIIWLKRFCSQAILDFSKLNAVLLCPNYVFKNSVH